MKSKKKSKTEFSLENIINSLLSVRGAKPGKEVNLEEEHIITLCRKSRDLFLSQPIRRPAAKW